MLTLESRRRIYEFVKKRPGSHLREVARSLDLPLGTTLYHLDCLAQTEMVDIRRDGRYKRYFLRQSMGRAEKDYVSAFHHAVPRKIALVLLTHGRSTQRELCAAVGVSRSTLSFHVRNLEAKGILRRHAKWPENQYEVAEPDVARGILRAHKMTFSAGLTPEFQHLLDAIADARTTGSATIPLHHMDANARASPA